MKKSTGKLLAALMATVMMLVFTGCGEDTEPKDYGYLKTEIVGAWCDINGPEKGIVGDGTEIYNAYEFTEDGRMIYHQPSKEGSFYFDDTYEIEDNYFISSSGAKCIIEIENDILTMTNNKGDTQYRRMTVEETSEYGIYYVGSQMYQEQMKYLGIDGNAETTITVGGIFYDSEENSAVSE